jgi:hypothetical protein
VSNELFEVVVWLELARAVPGLEFVVVAGESELELYEEEIPVLMFRFIEVLSSITIILVLAGMDF